jgi:hypothetical protein
VDSNGYEVSLAGCDSDMIGSSTKIMREDQDGVAFSIEYEIGSESLEETYQLSSDGLLYSVKGDMNGIHIIVPLISTDGSCKSRISIKEEGLVLGYRKSWYKVICEQLELTGELCVNRNGIYRIARIRDHMIKLQLIEGND